MRLVLEWETVTKNTLQDLPASCLRSALWISYYDIKLQNVTRLHFYTDSSWRRIYTSGGRKSHIDILGWTLVHVPNTVFVLCVCVCVCIFNFFTKPLRDFTPPLNVHDFLSSYTIHTIPLSVAGTFPVLPLSVCFPPSDIYKVWAWRTLWAVERSSVSGTLGVHGASSFGSLT